MITKKNLGALRLKILYWFVFVGTASVTPFIGLYYKNVLRAPDGAPFIELIGVLLFIFILLQRYLCRPEPGRPRGASAVSGSRYGSLR